MDYEIKDSGARTNFDTGSVRDIQAGKGRYDLLPPDAIHVIAQHFEKGANKYAARNWEKGQPLSQYLNSGLRHAFKYLMGHRDEDHLAAACWNFMCAVATRERILRGVLPAKLNDLPPEIEEKSKFVNGFTASLENEGRREIKKEVLNEIEPYPVDLLDLAGEGSLKGKFTSTSEAVDQLCEDEFKKSEKLNESKLKWFLLRSIDGSHEEVPVGYDFYSDVTGLVFAGASYKSSSFIFYVKNGKKVSMCDFYSVATPAI